MLSIEKKHITKQSLKQAPGAFLRKFSYLNEAITHW